MDEKSDLVSDVAVRGNPRAPLPSSHESPSAFTFWKVVLAWGCLIVFFGLPILFFMLHMTSIFNGFGLHDGAEFRYLTEFLRTVTAIIISLAGFDTVALFKK